MFYVDSQRTITRRDSSLITTARSSHYADTPRTARGQSSVAIEHRDSINVRPKGSVQKELVTLFFESMLKHIVESWDVLVQEISETDIEKTSEVAVSKKKGKESGCTGPSSTLPCGSNRDQDGLVKLEHAWRNLTCTPQLPYLSIAKSTKSKQTSKDFSEAAQIEICNAWWSGSDERAIIHFQNGNLYEGNISMKCMHGEGRFQWADGTVYLGQFKNNEMVGNGMIQWKNDTWYQGEFMGNLRHGRGLYVDSRKQTSYVGGWHLGTKHGQGAIYYSPDFTNSYDGEWVKNIRHGLGSREYCHSSGYKGEWDTYLREGKGLMIWPNHDFYSGDWKNNVMSGFGIYIWDMYYNNTMSLPSINVFRGEWHKGKRNGYGVLNLGYGLGSHYKGDFKNNLKHGVGKLVTNNGQILRHKALFIDDNLGPHESDSECGQLARAPSPKQPKIHEPIQFDLCDSSPNLIYHVQQSINNIDRQTEVREAMISDFIENNRHLEFDVSTRHKDEDPKEQDLNIKDLIAFEEISLRKALRCYETELRNIYYKYAKVCNTEEIDFTPNLIRLYLWQLYFDCNIHQKGLTLVQIDNLFSKNPEWLACNPHNPFEKIYFWQFVHSLITVASELYAKRQFPGPKPDTILACAFRRFMEKDVLPGLNNNKGYLVKGYGVFMPLKGLYALYRSIGEPHTVRAFLRSARYSHHDFEHPQPPVVDAPDGCSPIGRNAYVFGDEMSFPVEGYIENCTNEDAEKPELKLFNFGNLSCRTIIKIFAKIFPQVFGDQKILDLDVEITFYEFFEAVIACTEESIRQKDDDECQEVATHSSQAKPSKSFKATK